MDFGVRDHVVVVTGGASGIGLATVRLAAEQGAKVAVIDREAELNERIVSEIAASGGTAWSAVVDVRDEEAMARAMRDLDTALGGLDIVVAAAGISRPSLAEDMSAVQFSETLDVNLTGMFVTAAAAGAVMLPRRKGAFVAIGSTDSFGGHAERSHYAASKHGVAGLVKTLAIEWGARGVRANVVAPGPVDTPLLRQNHSQESINKNFLSRLPMGRMADPADLAKAALFLGSEGASFITGAVLPVDGGLTAGYFNQML